MKEIQREQFGDFSVLHREASGKPRVALHFLHATGFNAETYRLLLSRLDPAFDVYAMDARGHGLSRAVADPRRLHSWAPFRRDLEALVETLPRPLVLVGHSMGATVSMELAARRPGLVEGLVMIDPVVFPPGWALWALASRSFGLLGRKLPVAQMAAKRRMEFPSKEAAVDNYVGKGAFKTWSREWIEAYVDGGTVPVDSGVRLSCKREWESRVFAKSTVNPYPSLRKVSCPITLITREHEGPPFTRASRDEFMRCQPGTRLRILQDATHFLAMEQPEIVQAEIERMVDAIA